MKRRGFLAALFAAPMAAGAAIKKAALAPPVPKTLPEHCRICSAEEIARIFQVPLHLIQ